MKTKIIGATLAAGLILAAFAGCGRKEATPSSTSEASKANQSTATDVQQAAADAAKQVEAAASQVTQQVQQAATEAKTAVEQAKTEAAKQADAAVAQAQTLIEKAKTLVTEKQYPEAMNLVNQLTEMKLSPDQQKLVSDLKAQVQKLMSGSTVSNAVESAAGLLGK
jgi:F0F1-type ATP synthase membrane subunit b/b'